ncbi:MAG: Alpha/beta fold family hydrolase [Promethearchaeota archaeon]|nr:MAG: Alpha/beta fold family hydrolase [Candidatus Lokiarchaeota archaeon]
MKILIYGAGFIGSIFGYFLKTGGNEINILARGKRIEELKGNGIIIYDEIYKKEYQTEIEVVDQLSPEEYYDVVLIIMPRHQTSTILPILAKNTKIPTYVFIGNNVSGSNEYEQVLGKDRILLGFEEPGGYRDNGKVIAALW